MDKGFFCCLAASALAIANGPALADPPQHSLATTRLLVAACQAEQATLRGMCIGYLGAMVDGVVWLQKDGARMGLHITARLSGEVYAKTEERCLGFA
jgi:hypothetical protein